MSRRLVIQNSVASSHLRRHRPKCKSSANCCSFAEHEHTEMLKEAAGAGRLNLISYNGRAIPRGFLGAGVFVAVSELERYLAGLAVPISLRIGAPEVQASEPAARAKPAPKGLSTVCGAMHSHSALRKQYNPLRAREAPRPRVRFTRDCVNSLAALPGVCWPLSDCTCPTCSTAR